MKFIKEHPINETQAPSRPGQGDDYQNVQHAGDFPTVKPKLGDNARHKQGDVYQQLAQDLTPSEMAGAKSSGKAQVRPAQGDTYQRLSLDAEKTQDGSSSSVKHNKRPNDGDDYQNVKQGPAIAKDTQSTVKNNPRPSQGDTYQHLSDFKSFFKQ